MRPASASARIDRSLVPIVLARSTASRARSDRCARAAFQSDSGASMRASCKAASPMSISVSGSTPIASSAARGALMRGSVGRWRPGARTIQHEVLCTGRFYTKPRQVRLIPSWLGKAAHPRLLSPLQRTTWMAGPSPTMTALGRGHRELVLFGRRQIDFLALLDELLALLLQPRHALSLHAQVLRDFHRAEFRAAHRAEMRDLVCVLRQRLVVEVARRVGIGGGVELILPGELEP